VFSLLFLQRECSVECVLYRMCCEKVLLDSVENISARAPVNCQDAEEWIG
jgi:hypothetical protein